MRKILIAGIALGALQFASDAVAQNATVQLPSLGRFSVGTTVVVPDRGRAYLGGVKRAAESTQRFGPLVRGSNKGLERSHAGMTASAYIHDLREMDRRLLEQGRIDVARRSGPPLKGYAGHAYRSLTGVRGMASVPSRPSTGSNRYQRPAIRDSKVTSTRRGDTYYRIALQAEATGNRAKARVLFGIAARHGSEAAKARLARGR